MAIKLGTWETSDPAWHAARRHRIGGSDIGVIMGWSPYLSPGDLLAMKLDGQHVRDTPAMTRGRYLEPAIAAWLAESEGLTYNPEMIGTFVHEKWDWMLFNPDRVTTDGRLVEIKTAAEKTAAREWGRAGTDQIPLTYQAQCQWGMGILDLPTCLVGVCFGSPFEFRRYRLRFDPEAFDYLRATGERFVADLTAKAA